MKAKLQGKDKPEKPEKPENKAEEEQPEERTGAAADAVAVAGGAAGDAEFQCGQEVMGVATKAKEKWAQKGVITEIMSRHYKVRMLEGAATGEIHKFLKAYVRAIPAPAAPAEPVASAEAAVATAAPDAAPDASPSAAPAPAQTGVDSDMRDVGELFT